MNKQIDKSSGKGTLYIVSTPIGNMEDITIRAIRILFEVDIILAEDTRRTYTLLKKITQYNPTVQFKIPLLESFFEGNENEKIEKVLSWLNEGKQIALVSNAGTPLVSDPGYKLVRECVNQNISVTSLPGPNAAISALTVSGLPPDKFLFLGFLPRKSSKRNKILNSLPDIKRTLNPTIIIYESPYRLVKTLTDLEKVTGDTEVCVVRELTKKFEEVKKDNIGELIKYYKSKTIKGEFVILF